MNRIWRRTASLAATAVLAAAAHAQPPVAQPVTVRHSADEKFASVEHEYVTYVLGQFPVVATYLAAFFVPETGAAIKFLWWTHTLALLVFLFILALSRPARAQSAPWFGAGSPESKKGSPDMARLTPLQAVGRGLAAHRRVGRRRRAGGSLLDIGAQRWLAA